MIATKLCDGKYVVFSEIPLEADEIAILEENPEIIINLMKKKGISYPCATIDEARHIVKRKHSENINYSEKCPKCECMEILVSEGGEGYLCPKCKGRWDVDLEGKLMYFFME